MDYKQMLKFLVVAVLVFVGMMLYDGNPMTVSIAFAVAGLVVFGKTITAWASPPVNFIGLAIVWVGVFYVSQVILGYAFGVPLEDLAARIDAGGLKTILQDSSTMGKLFLKQVLSLVLASIIAWWFIRIKHRGWLLATAALVCFGQLVYSTYLVPQSWFRMWSREKREGAVTLLQEDANSSSLDSQFRRAVSLGLPKMTIEEDGIPLWFSEKQPDPPLAMTKKGDVYMFNLSNMRNHPDPLLRQVRFVWACKETKGRYDTAGFFRLDLVAKYIEPVIGQEPLVRLQPPVPKPVAPRPPVVQRQPTVQPAIAPALPTTPVVSGSSVVYTDQVLATLRPVPTKIIPQQHDRVIVKIGKQEDAARMQISWGGRTWDDVQPEFVEGQWGAILLFDLGKNPNNQPLLVKVKSGNPIPVTLTKQ